MHLTGNKFEFKSYNLVNLNYICILNIEWIVYTFLDESWCWQYAFEFHAERFSSAGMHDKLFGVSVREVLKATGLQREEKLEANPVPICVHSMVR